MTIDEQIEQGVVNSDGFNQLIGAEVYGAATPLQWLSKRLNRIRTLIKGGMKFSYDTGFEAAEISTIDEFENWCRKYFPEGYQCLR
ncbi:TPA: hypothetical protein ACPVZC_003105 [Vibrio parahaemolyticus]